MSNEATARKVDQLDAVTEKMCEHIAKQILEKGYVRGSDGKLQVKTCNERNPDRSPMRAALRDTCGKTSPIGAETCYSCGGTNFSEMPDGIIEIEVCHKRCTRCKSVTRGCGVEACGHCGATILTELPPAVNPDLYGWKVYLPNGTRVN